MDKVWIIVEHEKHEGSSILKVFSNEKAAQLWVSDRECMNERYKSGMFWLAIEELYVEHSL